MIEAEKYIPEGSSPKEEKVDGPAIVRDDSFSKIEKFEGIDPDTNPESLTQELQEYIDELKLQVNNARYDIEVTGDHRRAISEIVYGLSEVEYEDMFRDIMDRIFEETTMFEGMEEHGIVDIIKGNSTKMPNGTRVYWLPNFLARMNIPMALEGVYVGILMPMIIMMDSKPKETTDRSLMCELFRGDFPMAISGLHHEAVHSRQIFWQTNPRYEPSHWREAQAFKASETPLSLSLGSDNKTLANNIRESYGDQFSESQIISILDSVDSLITLGYDDNEISLIISDLGKWIRGPHCYFNNIQAKIDARLEDSDITESELECLKINRNAKKISALLRAQIIAIEELNKATS